MRCDDVKKTVGHLSPWPVRLFHWVGCHSPKITIDIII